MTNASPISLEDLMVRFEFGPDDLVANRHGKLSPAQYERLAGRNRFVRLVFLLIGVPVLLALCAVVAISFAAGDVMLGVVMAALLGLFMAGIILLARRMSRALLDDLANGTVAAITGEGRAFSVHYWRGATYYLSVSDARAGDQRFEVLYPQYRLIKDAESAVFTAYYAPKSRILVALEPGKMP